MSNRSNFSCSCRRCTIRSLMGPAAIITVGVLFLLQQTHSGNFNFGRTWPVIMVVLGVISLASALAPMDGHIAPPIPPAVTPGAPVPPQSPAPGSFPRQGQ